MPDSKIVAEYVNSERERISLRPSLIWGDADRPCLVLSVWGGSGVEAPMVIDTGTYDWLTEMLARMTPGVNPNDPVTFDETPDRQPGQTSVVAAGSLIEGLNFVYGPFDTETDAIRWSDQQPWDAGADWWVLQLVDPTSDLDETRSDRDHPDTTTTDRPPDTTTSPASDPAVGLAAD